MASSKLDFLRDRLNISRLAIQHSWLTVCCWIVVAVAGLFAFSSLRYALFPDITFPVVVVNASAPIETALASETQLTLPLEAELQPLEGLNKIISSTTAGRTVMNLRFRVGTNLADATAAVEQVITQTDLPSETDSEVIPLNLNEAAVVSYAIASETLTLEDLAKVAETSLLPPLSDIEGVLRVDLRGTGLPTETVARESDEAETTFLTELNNPPTLIRFDGEDRLALQVVKQGEANTLEVIDRVEEAVQQIQADFPEVQLTLAVTQADYIRAATRATIDSLLGAILIAVLVIFGFLRSWRATLITAL
ncbi:MAG: efflux RND transporter permease subunit, partial [Cyanobacteria bacterium J06559_3]